MPAPTNTPRADRRAFALPLMLVVLLSVSLIVTVAMQRHAAQVRVVERQINEYKRRHDMYGVRATVLHWVKNISRGELQDMAGKPSAVHVFELPSGATATARVIDAQGLPVRGATDVDNDIKEFYRATLARLYSRPDLTRGVGPWQINVASAPREVLEALPSDNGPAFAEEILALRRGGETVDRAAFSEVVSNMPLDGEDRRFLTRVAAFDSSLWKIIVDTEDWAGRRRYDMLLLRTPSETTVHEWFEYAQADLQSREDREQSDEQGGS